MIKQLLTIVALHASQVSFQSNQLEKIIVVFGNHLDIGFEAHKGVGFAKNVVTRYFQDYFPKAIRILFQ